MRGACVRAYVDAPSRTKLTRWARNTYKTGLNDGDADAESRRKDALEHMARIEKEFAELKDRYVNGTSTSDACTIPR